MTDQNSGPGAEFYAEPQAEDQNEELPFATASAVKPKNKNIQDNGYHSPPFSPAQQTPQKNFILSHNEGTQSHSNQQNMHSSSNYGGIYDSELQHRGAPLFNPSISARNHQHLLSTANQNCPQVGHQLTSAQSRKMLGPGLFPGKSPANQSMSNNGSSTTAPVKNSKIIREKHLQMQRQQNRSERQMMALRNTEQNTSIARKLALHSFNQPSVVANHAKLRNNDSTMLSPQVNGTQMRLHIEKTDEEAATPQNKERNQEFESNGQLGIDEGQSSEYRHPFDMADCQEQMQAQQDGQALNFPAQNYQLNSIDLNQANEIQKQGVIAPPNQIMIQVNNFISNGDHHQQQQQQPMLQAEHMNHEFLTPGSHRQAEQRGCSNPVATLSDGQPQSEDENKENNMNLQNPPKAPLMNTSVKKLIQEQQENSQKFQAHFLQHQRNLSSSRGVVLKNPAVGGVGGSQSKNGGINFIHRSLRTQMQTNYQDSTGQKDQGASQFGRMNGEYGISSAETKHKQGDKNSFSVGNLKHFSAQIKGTNQGHFSRASSSSKIKAQQKKVTDSIQCLQNNNQQPRWAGIINKASGDAGNQTQMASAGGAGDEPTAKEQNWGQGGDGRNGGFLGIYNIKIDPNEFKKYNFHDTNGALNPAEIGQDSNPEHDNENNIKKIQQLELGDTHEDKSIKSAKNSSSNTLERDSKDEDLEAEFENANRINHDHDEEEENTVNELTMNNMIDNQNLNSIFTKEREYDERDLGKPLGAPLAKGNIASRPPCIAFPTVHQQQRQLLLNQLPNNEQNQIQIGGISGIQQEGAFNKNENTSSSLGKRNYNEYQKNQQENKENKHRSQIAYGTTSNKEEDNQRDVDQRIKKTPARRLNRPLQRTNSDNFGADQVQQSGKKLIDQDINNKNDDSSNLQIGGTCAAGNIIYGVKSDVMMSSSCNCDIENGENFSLDGAEVILNKHNQNDINFQNMGHIGQCNHVIGYGNTETRPLQFFHQFSGNGSSFDYQNSDNAAGIGQGLFSSCHACSLEDQSNSTSQNTKENKVLKHLMNAQQNVQYPQGKGTPNFIKQNVTNSSVCLKALILNNDQNLVDGQNGQGDDLENQAQSEANDSEMQQQMKDEPPSTMAQTETFKLSNFEQQMQQAEIGNKMLPKIAQQCTNGEEPPAFPTVHGQTPFMMPSIQLAIQGHLENQQNSQQMEENNFNSANQQSLCRRLSYRSISNTSSNIETPMQPKRMKPSSSHQNSQLQTSNRVKGKVFEMNCQNMRTFGSNNAFFQQIMMQSEGGRPSANIESLQMQNEPQVSGANQGDLHFSVPQPALRKSITTKDGSPQSLLQRWRCSDPIFKDKFFSGATPPSEHRLSKPHSSNLQNFGDKNEPLRSSRSKTHYAKRATINQTLQKLDQKQFDNLQEDSKGEVNMRRTFSPNADELQALASVRSISEMNMNDTEQSNQAGTQHPYIIQNDESMKSNVFTQKPKKQGKSNCSSTKNALAQSHPNPPMIINQVSADFQAYQMTNNFFQTVNEKHNQIQIVESPHVDQMNIDEKKENNSNQVYEQLQPQILADHNTKANLSSTMQALRQPKHYLSKPAFNRMNSDIRLFEHEYGENYQNMSNGHDLKAAGNYPSATAEEANALETERTRWRPHPLQLTKINSSLSSHAAISIHTCQKHKSMVTNGDRKSLGGPKTPVGNTHHNDIFKRNSQISVTNTSMHNQSLVSSSLDTDGNQYHPNGKKRGNPKVKQFCMGQVNQFMHPINTQNPLNPQSKRSFGSSSNLQTQLAPQQWNAQVANLSQQNSMNQKYSQQYGVEDKYYNTKTSQLAQIKQIQSSSNSKKPIPWLDKEFTRLDTLGRGHFGQVLRCQNNTDKFQYAIKITNSRIRNPWEKAFYLQEMQTLSALSVEAECPHIVRYFNSWIEDDRIHIVMELCEKSLRKVKQEAMIYFKKFQRASEKQDQSGEQQPQEALNDEVPPEYNNNGHISEVYLTKVIRDILLGLDELHSQDIVHLDIKPENILKGKTGNYKLGDLGMSRFLTRITEDTNIPEGDCRYLAQELLSKDVLAFLPDLKKCDIFSLGITAYELITLEKLELNGPEWRALRNDSFQYPSEVQQLYSLELLDCIRQMLSPNTDDRPSAAELLSTVFISSEQRRIQQLEAENLNLAEHIRYLNAQLSLLDGAEHKIAGNLKFDR